ncbi:MAG: UvrD-helicase domain-containing protein [Dactylosporangium sp.]|nr:UvrD-helicase domain-containing protein [Dactylosporangium sp.]NNJ60585.1 UvrD-helicase domain-containing protein [Dactylosporangium sp.]
MLSMKPAIEVIDNADIEWVAGLMGLHSLDEPRRAFLKSTQTIDLSACPGSGKTTLVVAKLAILARKWPSMARGICVLSHTNVAREEIQKRLGGTEIGRKLLGYPHYIDTIHSFVSQFLARPWLLSSDYPVTAIDNDITTNVRLRHLGSQRRKVLTALNPKHIEFSSLRLRSADFSTPLESTQLKMKPTAPTFLAVAEAMQKAAEQGYYCYDEIFTFGGALLDEHPEVAESLVRRFPVVLIDEMQDTSQLQSEILRRVFPRDRAELCVQRVGDANQAIYEGDKSPVSDVFPDPTDGRSLTIGSSFRFDQSIASLATGLAIIPVGADGLQGIRNRKPAEPPCRHTVFIFPDGDTSQVLSAYARHALSTLDPMVLTKARVAAVGSVHQLRPEIAPGHKHFPASVSHYWQDYKITSLASARPTHLIEYVHSAQAIVIDKGNLCDGVNGVAEGIIRLANTLAERPVLRAFSRPHRLLERLLADNAATLGVYRSMLRRLLVDREVMSLALWPGISRDLIAIAEVASGCSSPGSSPDPFLELTAEHKSSFELKVRAETPPNTYRFQDAEQTVDVRIGSIHSVKGQTHTATLVLDTYNNGHHMERILPWLLGDRVGDQGVSSDLAAKRLRLAYVAMTRPTHLLCLALRRSSIGKGCEYEANKEKLVANGWNFIEL